VPGARLGESRRADDVAADPIVIDGHILVVANCLAVSFQRYPENMLRGAAEVPRSYGALPVELSSPGRGFLPVRPGEAIWLGLSPQGRQECVVKVGWLGTAGSGDVPLSWSATLSSLQTLHGLHKPDGGFCPFARFPLSRDLIPCDGVVISVGDAESIEVRFISVAEFEAQAGKPAPRPMSPDDSYGGWRLP
jgi:hypothetical protein